MPALEPRAWAGALLLCVLAPLAAADVSVAPVPPPASEGKCVTGLDFHGYTVPRGRIVVEHGSSLEIYCFIDLNYALSKGRNASDIRFYRNAEQLPQEYVEVLNVTTARLLEPEPEASTSKYYCRLHLGGKKQSLLCLNEVVVGYKPQPVENFSCLSSNWESLQCTWKVPENPLRTRYKIVYGLQGRGQRWVFKCPGETEERFFCRWDTNTEPPFRPSHQYFVFQFTGSNDLGNLTFSRIKFHVWAHVLPSKPLYLSSEEITTNSAHLQWDIPANMRKFPPGLERKIQYKSMCDPTDVWETADTSQLPKMNTTFALTGLKYPNTLYDVRLYLKSPMAIGDDMWSEPASYTFKTKPTVPSSPPKVDSGSFQIIGRLHRRDIIIYWQRIPKCSENGDDFSYNVSSVEHNGNVINIRPTKIGKSYARFDHMTTDSYTFHIVSANKEGISEDTSIIHVPAKKMLPQPPVGFSKYVNEKGVIQLSWNHPNDNEWADKIESYTVFWCENDRDGPNHCAGYLNWTRVSKESRTMNVTVREGKVYEFAISSNTNVSSSGMIWATCTLRPNNGLEKVKEIGINKVGATFIEVHFAMECQNRLQNVTKYQVHYCPIISPHNATCRTPAQVMTVVGHNVSMQANLTGLQPYTTYMIYVAREADNGMVSDASEYKYSTTLETVPTVPKKVSVSSIGNDSFVVSWEPPAAMNGKFHHYDVNYNGKLIEVDSPEQTILTLRNLSSFTLYNVSVRACGIQCSNYSEPQRVRTNIGMPGVMERPVAHVQNFSKIVVKWKDPDHSGGRMDFYQLLVQPSDNTSATKEYNLTAAQAANRSAHMTIPECRDPNRFYRVTIRAVNIDAARQGKIYYGPWSDVAETYCSSTDPLEKITIFKWCMISISILVFVMLMGYLGWKFVTWLNVAHKIEVKLPPGLAPLTIDKEKDEGYHMKVPWQIYSIRDSKPAGAEGKGGEPDCSLLGAVAQRSPSADSSGCSSDRGDCRSSSLTTATRVSSATTDSGTEADGERQAAPGLRPLACLYAGDGAASWSTPDLSGRGCYAHLPAAFARADGEPYCRAGYLPSPPPPAPTLAASRGYVSVASVASSAKQQPPLAGSGSVDDWLSALEAAEAEAVAAVKPAAPGHGYVSLPFAAGSSPSPAPAGAANPGYVTLASLPSRAAEPQPAPAQEDVPPFIRQRLADMRALRRRRRADQRPDAAASGASDLGVIIPAKDVEGEAPVYAAALQEPDAAPDYVKLSYVQCAPDDRQLGAGNAGSQGTEDDYLDDRPAAGDVTHQPEPPALLVSFR